MDWQSVWKTRIGSYAHQETVVMPQGSKPLTAQIQRAGTKDWDRISIWWLVNPNPNLPQVERTIIVETTGFPFTHKGTYIATVQDDYTVFHIFDLGET